MEMVVDCIYAGKLKSAVVTKAGGLPVHFLSTVTKMFCKKAQGKVNFFHS
jgi:hypothetical protein